MLDNGFLVSNHLEAELWSDDAADARHWERAG